MIPRGLTGLLADCGVLCAELAEATYLGALKLSPAEARVVAACYWCLSGIASGDPLPAEAEALPLARWLSDGLRATLAPEPPSELHRRLNLALRVLTVTRGPLTPRRRARPAG